MRKSLFGFKISPLFCLLILTAVAVLFGPHSLVAAQLAAMHVTSLDQGSLAFGLGLGGMFVGNITPFPTRPDLLAVKMAYKNSSLIADRLMPRVPVNKRDFKYTYFEKGDTFRVPNTLIGRRGKANQVELMAHEATGSCESYGLDYGVPQDDLLEAPENYDPLAIAASAISNWVALDREVRVAGIVFAAATYAASNKVQLAGNHQWDKFTQADADPIEDITTALDVPIMRPNFMAIGRAAYSKLARNPNIIKSLGNTTGTGIAPRRAIADLFELEDIIVGESFVNSAKKGQSAVISRTWGKHCLLFFQDKNFNNVQEGITFAWTAHREHFAGTAPDKDIGPKGGQMVRVGETVAEHVMAADLGYFIQDCVA
jgi:hypothetical protein